jgi:catalase
MSPALSMANSPKDSIKSRKIAFLAADGVDGASLMTVKTALEGAGAMVEIIAPRLNFILSETSEEIPVNHSFLTAASVLYDAVYVPGGTNSVATVEAEANAVHFLNEAFKHCKAIAADAGAMQVLESTYFSKKLPEDFSDKSVLINGVVISDDAKNLARQFIMAIAQHRFWERETQRRIPA